MTLISIVEAQDLELLRSFDIINIEETSLRCVAAIIWNIWFIDNAFPATRFFSWFITGIFCLLIAVEWNPQEGDTSEGWRVGVLGQRSLIALITQFNQPSHSTNEFWCRLYSNVLTLNSFDHYNVKNSVIFSHKYVSLGLLELNTNGSVK